MKYLLGLFVLLLSFFAIAKSQEDVLRPRGYPKYISDDYKMSNFKKSSVTIGIEGGLNYNIGSQNVSATSPIFNLLESANGLSPHFGGLIDIPINDNLGFQVRLAYDSKFVETSGSGFDTTYTDFTGHLLNMKAGLKANYFAVSPGIRINADENLFFTLGFSFQFLSGDMTTDWEASVSPFIPVFLDEFTWWGLGLGMEGTSDKVQTIETTALKTRIALEGGVGYKINLSDDVWLVPSARFQFFVSKWADDTQFFDVIVTDKKLHTLQFSLALWFDL